MVKGLPHLSPEQVVHLKDALLANADRLLISAQALVDAGDLALARSAAILGMEESAKAIAIHDRQVAIAYDIEGANFVTEALSKLWSLHNLKLETVHRFLVDEDYWFGSPPDLEANEAALGEIKSWAREHNILKQRGFYVDVADDGDVIEPSSSADEATLAAAIAYIHQIGWQLRLGEHIDAKGQAEDERVMPPSTEEKIAEALSIWGDRLPDETRQLIAEGMRLGKAGTTLNNAAYRLHLPAPGTAPFANLGRPGYEAETRKLLALQEALTESNAEQIMAEPSVEDEPAG